MKRLFGLILVTFMLFGFSANAQTKSTKDESSIKTKIEVYYFHGDRKCKTCIEVGRISEEYLKKEYAKQMKAGIAFFKELNFEDKENAKIVKELEVSGSALFVRKIENGKVSAKDLTGTAFVWALANPSKVEAALEKELKILK